MNTTVGKLLVENALPEGYKINGPLEKKSANDLFTRLAKEHPEDYVETLQKLNDIAKHVVYNYGREASLGLSDLKLPPDVMVEKEKLRAFVKATMNDKTMTSDQKLDKIQAESETTMDGLEDRIYKSALAQNSGFAHQILSGSRGNKTQLMQMIFGDMLLTDATGKVIPLPITSSYGEGVSPLHYWLGASSARKGYVDTQFITADAGYFGKQMTNVGHRSVVTTEDCGVQDAGLSVKGDDGDNVGSVLLRPVGGIPAGHIITEDDMPKLQGKNIMVRSALTCQAPEGICSKCAGVREKGVLPIVGEQVGINAVRSFVEALTQSGLGSKHVGGVAGKNKPKFEQLTGFKAVNQMTQMPIEFVGGSVLSQIDGRVSAVVPAPQGGTYVRVGDQQYHVPMNKGVTVKIGDTVEAGDSISEGVPNPAEITKLKGMGPGRRYFLDQFRKTLDDNGAGTHRRNLEVFARSLLSKVKVKDTDGLAGSDIDDIIDYDEMAAKWEPREGSKLQSVQTAHNLYLEKPYLHYTVGTHITPKVSQDLKASGFDNVLAHKDPPPFEPMPIRAQAFIQFDKDWVTRLGGENLKKTLVSAANIGAKSQKDSLSYFPRLLNIAEQK